MQDQAMQGILVAQGSIVLAAVYGRHQLGAAVTERERLEREIHQLTLIIDANRDALASKMMRPEDRPALQKQIDIRTARREELQRQVEAVST